MENIGKAVVHRPDNVVVALVVPENVVLGAQHLLGLSNRHADGDRIASMRTVRRSDVKVVSLEPGLHKVH